MDRRAGPTFFPIPSDGEGGKGYRDTARGLGCSSFTTGQALILDALGAVQIPPPHVCCLHRVETRGRENSFSGFRRDSARLQ